MRETFAALDGDTPSRAFNWVHAGTSRAEAAFEDPTLGWVGVRADLGGGSVHASLVPGSAEAAQTLGSHLAGLNEYLAERHPGVAIVTVAGHENGVGIANTRSGTGSESGAQSGSQSSSQQDSAGNSGEGWNLADAVPVSRSEKAIAQPARTLLVSPAVIQGTEIGGREGRNHISVMA
jgi:hypothetical protein